MKTFCYPFLAGFIIITLFYSCRSGGPCEEPLFITNSGIQVVFKDSTTNKYLYDEDHPLYNKDTIKIYDPQGVPLMLLYSLNNDVAVPSTRFWEINFGSLFDYRSDSVSFAREICKDFIVQYSYDERDTITTCFKSKDEKCGSVFTTLKVYYKGRLLASETNTTGTVITIVKN